MAVAWFFGDGFDAYREMGDAILSYWDSGNTTTSFSLMTYNSGRFTGSKALRGLASGGTTAGLVKSSGSNDATHHISVAFRNTSTSGTGIGFWFTLLDGSTSQCSVYFKTNGDIVLTAGNSAGSVLATYSGAVSSDNTWFYFEIEVVINNTTGSIKVRKNGNTSDDFSSTGLNTRASANNYANKIGVGSTANAAAQYIDDFLWRSDSTVAWAGDIRCFTRFPTADSSIQFTPSGVIAAVTPYIQGTTSSIAINGAKYTSFVATCAGTVATAVLSLALGFTGNMKCTLFNDSGSNAPGTVLASANTVSNPTAGNNTFTFASPPTVVQGTLYWIGFDSDTATSNAWNVASSISAALPPIGALANSGGAATVTYASFPTASPTITTFQSLIFTINITPTTANNAMLVAEVTNDEPATYVSDSVSGDVDFYTPQAISATPSTVLGVTTRALAQKTDAGTRNLAVQIKSGASTSTGTSTALSTTWNWIFATNQTDPATGAAWGAVAVNNCTFGPKITA